MTGALLKDSFGWVKVEALDALRRLGDQKEALAQAKVLRKLEADGNKDKSKSMAQLVCRVAAIVCTEKPDQDACKNTLRELDDHLRASGSSMLFEAAHRGCSDIVKAMIGLGADVNAAKADGRTALMAAAATGHVETVQALLSGGADAALTDKDGKTALTLAEAEGHSDVADILREHGPAL